MQPRPHSCFRHPSREFVPVAAALFSLVAAVSTASAQSWTEVGDAGQTLGTAQVTAGTGTLSLLQGTLSSKSDVDLYCIRIDDETTFLASRICAAISEIDIWLFDAFGNGVTMHDGCSGGFTLVTGASVTGPGIFYVGVSGNGADAMNASDIPIWLAGPSSPERAPDGAGAPGPLSHWYTDVATVSPANYELRLEATSYCDAPVPTSTASWGRLKVLYR